MLYCNGKHKLKMVSEKGKTPYLKCHCGYNELIPGARPWDPDDPEYRSLTGMEIALCLLGGSIAAGIVGLLIHVL